MADEQVVRVFLPLIRVEHNLVPTVEMAYRWPTSGLVFDLRESYNHPNQFDLDTWGKHSEPRAAQGLMVEQALTDGGIWVLATEVGLGGRLRQRDNLEPWKPYVELEKNVYHHIFGSVMINGEQRYASWSTFLNIEVDRGNGLRRVQVQALRVRPRRLEPVELHASDVPVSPQMEVIRDLVLEQGSPRMMTPHVEGAGPRDLPGHCVICQRRFNPYMPYIQFTVPPAADGLFFAMVHRGTPADVDPSWAQMIASENDTRLAAGETARVHPECIGLTADW